MGEPRMTAPEPLCDLQMIKADYRLVSHKDRKPDHCFRIRISPKSPQQPGMATSTEGSVAAWQVTFELDEDESLHAAISISLAGPPTHHEAQQKALKVLQVFLNDACEAAKKYQFSN